MPIVIKNYVWQQTEKYITIKLPLKNVNKKEVDLLTTKCYIKASYYPYFFELFLLKPIDVDKSNCYIQDEEIIFEVCKEEIELWDDLEAKINKAEKLELKKKYLEDLHNECKEKDEEKANKRGELKRQAVREQIEIDKQFREKIDNIKKEETRKALQELKLPEDIQEKPVKNKIPTLPSASPPPPKNYNKKTSVPKLMSPIKKSNISNSPVPLPRKSQSINITFTERVFPTPSRESKAQEENEWLAKQAEARRTAGFIDEDLRPEEKNPQWLQDKGDEFLKAKNYLAAVSAYTTGIKLSKNLVTLYIGRSLAQFELQNFNKCVTDCSTALELMTPVCEANRKIRAECIGRRGKALFKLGLWRESIGEIEASLKLNPNDELKQHLEYIKDEIKKDKTRNDY